MSDLRHSIKAVARRTGLSPHVIRVWERRYKAVEPSRTDTNRRLYSDEDIERLGLLRKATLAGHSIGNVASLPSEQLFKIAAETPPAVIGEDQSPTTPARLIEECITAVRKMDAAEFDSVLNKGLLQLGQHGLLERVIAPLAQEVGELWMTGSILAAHEHFATAAIRNFLGRTSSTYIPSTNAPVIVVGTPAGQLHELGAVIVSAAAADVGWRVIYLGPSLPAHEIAAAAIQNKARAVALSLVYPEDDPKIPMEIRGLRSLLPASTQLIVGGRASEAYAPRLEGLDVPRITELRDFYGLLESLRKNT